MGQSTSQQDKAIGAAIRKSLDTNTAIRITILVAACLQIIAGSGAIIGWSEMINFTWGNVQHPVSIGVGVWAGFYALFPGMFGVFVYLKDIFTSKLRQTFFYVQFGMSLGMIGVTSPLVQWSVHVWRHCQRMDAPSFCEPSPSDMVAMGMMCIVMGTILLATVVGVVVCYALVVSKATKEGKSHTNYARTR